MRIRLWMFAVLMFCAAARGATNDLSGLLQQGLLEEEANRNLDAAISNYQTLAGAFDKDRQVAATAIFRLGECYRKLGRTNEAVAQYQRIVREFGDQQTLVTLSQQNLTGLGAGSSAGAENANLNQAELALVQASLGGLRSQLSAIEGMEPQQRRVFVQQNFPNPVLTDLMRQLNTAEQNLTSVKMEYSTEHPNYKNAQEQVSNLTERVDQQVAGVLASLKLKLSSMGQLQSATGGAGNAQSGENLITDEEQKEIRRIQLMIQNSPDLINSPDSDGQTPLLSASAKGQLVVAKYLLDHGADVNRTGQLRTGRSFGIPLYVAAQNGHKAMVELLLAHGANANGSGSLIPLQQAVNHGFYEVAAVLLANHADVNLNSERDFSPLGEATWGNRTNLIQLLIAHGAPVNEKDNNGHAPLDYAARNNSVDAAKMLLAAKADIAQRNNDGNTPLHEAAEAGSMDMVSFLIEAGASVDATNFNNATPLMLAVAFTHPAAALALLEHKADPNHYGTIPKWEPPQISNSRSDWHSPPIFFAVALTNDDLVKLLLDAGANPDGRPQTNWTPLASAIQDNYVNGVRLLLEHGANPNLRPENPNVESPLILALNRSTTSHEIIRLLLDKGANPNVKFRNGYIPLIVVSDPEIVGWLAEHKADVNARIGNGVTPLMWGSAPAEKLEVLLAHGANPDLQATNGNTALHYYVYGDRLDAVRILLAHHANPNIQNRLGYTPLDLAKSGLNGMVSYSMLDAQTTPNSGRTINDAPGMVDLLTKAGGQADLPKRDRIEARRISYSSNPIFRRGARDWNRFTLLELISAEYGLLSTNPVGEWRKNYGFQTVLLAENGFPFPNFKKIVIYRRTDDSAKQIAKEVNAEDILNSGDCSRDVWLEWGDVVEIPEADHPVDEKWSGLAESAFNALSNCVARHVTLKIKGDSVNLTLTTELRKPTPSPVSNQATLVQASFMLRSVLDNSKLVRVSSDLSRVHVIHHDPVTKKTEELTVDCTNPNDADLWLRDGDVIEVPER